MVIYIQAVLNIIFQNMRFYIPTICSVHLNCIRNIHGFVTPTIKPVVPILDKQNDPTVSVVILPGTLVRPKCYEPIAREIQDICRKKDIDVEISLARFTLNVGHRFQVDSMSNEIIKNTNTENIVLVGHSASAAVGIDICSKIKAKGFVQWCGTFNSRGSFPWEIYDRISFKPPILCILAEQDRMFSFTAALKDFDGLSNSPNMFPTCIKDAKHMSGVSKYQGPLTKRMKNNMGAGFLTEKGLHKSYVNTIAQLVSDFIGFTEGPSSPSYEVSLCDLLHLKEDFWIKYKGLISANVKPNAKSIIYGPEESEQKHRHIHTPRGMLLTMVYCGFPEIRHAIHFMTIMLPFIFSYNSVSICPLLNVVPGRKLNNPSIWAKIPLHTKKNFSRDTNSRTFKDALAEVGDKERQEYFKNGRPMVFGPDISIPLVPGCSIAWLVTPLGLKFGDKNDAVVVNSPTIRMNSRLNTKLISKEQCLEWILVKSFT